MPSVGGESVRENERVVKAQSFRLTVAGLDLIMIHPLGMAYCRPQMKLGPQIKLARKELSEATW